MLFYTNILAHVIGENQTVAFGQGGDFLSFDTADINIFGKMDTGTKIARFETIESGGKYILMAKNTNLIVKRSINTIILHEMGDKNDDTLLWSINKLTNGKIQIKNGGKCLLNEYKQIILAECNETNTQQQFDILNLALNLN